jgi:hypothetical protein
MNKKNAFTVDAKSYQKKGFRMVINDTNVPLVERYFMVVID